MLQLFDCARKACRFVPIFIVGVLLLSILAGCGDGTRTMKIDKVNAQNNTFSFVDTKSGNAIAYKKLIYEGKEVVDTHCMDGMAAGVVFAFNDNTIVRDGGSVKINGGQALTVHAVIKYKLEEGVLTILGIK